MTQNKVCELFFQTLNFFKLPIYDTGKKTQTLTRTRNKIEYMFEMEEQQQLARPCVLVVRSYLKFTGSEFPFVVASSMWNNDDSKFKKCYKGLSVPPGGEKRLKMYVQ